MKERNSKYFRGSAVQTHQMVNRGNEFNAMHHQPSGPMILCHFKSSFSVSPFQGRPTLQWLLQEVSIVEYMIVLNSSQNFQRAPPLSKATSGIM